MFQDYYISKFGPIVFSADEYGLLRIFFSNKKPTKVYSNHITNLTKTWLQNYFINNSDNLIELPISAKFSEFQKLVYKALKEQVVFGNYISYKNLSTLVNSSPRAIGRAMAINPICLYIPCHRVIKQNNQLGGFLYGKELKKHLLDHEQNIYNQLPT